jgi:putative alpha-1,2-mannosidase
MFIYGEFSANFTHSSAVGDQGKDRQYCIFNLNNNRTIEFKFATSFIGLTQAQHNLDLEIKNEHLSFDQLHQRATDT